MNNCEGEKMKTTDETSLNAVCQRCGKIFDKDQYGADKEQLHCASCMIKIAEEYAIEQEEESRLKKIVTGIRKSRVCSTLLWVIFCISIVVVGIQIPKLISAFEEKRPIRRGTYSTDVQTDQCIRNLWCISGLLQEGKAFKKEFVCPVSKEPYVITITEDDMVVECPNPGIHGCSKIQISKKNPIPKVIK